MSASHDLDDFTRAYIRCALWSSNDEDDTPLDSTYKVSDLHADALRRMVEDCRKFQAEHGKLFCGHERRAGHDFWLTRNGHGAGFWDGDWPEPAATELTEAAKRYGECALYVTETGLDLL